MKNMILISFLTVSTFVSAQFNLKVEVTGLKSNKGQVMIGLYNSENDFLKKTFKGNVVLISDKKAIITFSNIPKGEYAVSVFHDENSNGKLDSNFLGVPKEDYASSNGAKGFMGPPKYKDAKFVVKQDKTISLKI